MLRIGGVFGDESTEIVAVLITADREKAAYLFNRSFWLHRPATFFLNSYFLHFFQRCSLTYTSLTHDQAFNL